MKKRLLVTMLATAVVATMLTGCGGKLSEEQGTSTEAQTTIEQTAEPSGGETEVTVPSEETEPVADFQNGEPYATTYQDVLEPTEYRALTTGVRYVGFDYEEKLSPSGDGDISLGDPRYYNNGDIHWSKSATVETANGIDTMKLHFEFDPERPAHSCIRPYSGREGTDVTDDDINDFCMMYAVGREYKNADRETKVAKLLECAEVTSYKGDVLLCDSYTGICGDADFFNNYSTYRLGLTEKAEAGVSYKTEFVSNNKSITVDYKYGYNGDKPCVDITATYPEGYDGLNLMILGVDECSIRGDYVDEYISNNWDWDSEYGHYGTPWTFFGENKYDVVFATYGVPVSEGSSLSDQTMQTIETWADLILHDASYDHSEPFYDGLKGVSYICTDSSNDNKDAGIGYCDFEGEGTYNQYYNTIFNMRIDGSIVVVDPRTDYSQPENQ